MKEVVGKTLITIVSQVMCAIKHISAGVEQVPRLGIGMELCVVATDC